MTLIDLNYTCDVSVQVNLDTQTVEKVTVWDEDVAVTTEQELSPDPDEIKALAIAESGAEWPPWRFDP